MNFDEYYGEMLAITANMVITMRKKKVPNLPARAVPLVSVALAVVSGDYAMEEKQKENKMNMSVMLRLSKVLQQVGFNCMRMAGIS